MGSGWLTCRPQPETHEELSSWGADVVASLQTGNESADSARIVKEAASAGRLEGYGFFAITRKRGPAHTKDRCRTFGELVKFTAHHLERGHKVVIHCCGRGQRRTGIAIYLVLRYLGRFDASCLRTMERMRPEMYKQFVKQAAGHDFHRMAQDIFTNHSFSLRLEAL